MKLLQSIKTLTQKLQKKSFLAAGIVALGAGMALGAVQAEFYPDRQPFDYNQPCNPDDGNIYDRCGSLTGPVFNSFINTPYYGDERQFADAKRTDQNTGDVYKNVLPDVTDGSREVRIRVYVHNNANQSTNASGQGVATGAKVRIALPTGTEGSLRARSYISADNAALVEDTVDFTSTQKFRMEYIPGSATLFNNIAYGGGVKLSDSIVTTGALIGDDALDGQLPGCFDYQATVFINVKIIPEEKPAVELTKVTKDNKTGSAWGEVSTVAPGETINWLVGFKNAGNQNLTNVTLNDRLPPHMNVIPGTIRYIDSGQDTVLPDNGQFFTTGGYDFGTWLPGANFYVRFQTTALGDFEGCEVRVRNIATQKTTQLPSTEDSADTIIKKTDCVPTEQTVVCNSLTAPTLALKKGESTVFTATGTATGTTIDGYIFTVNGEEVQNSAANTYTFTAGNVGTYIVVATVKSPIGNRTSNECVKVLTVEEEPEMVVVCESLTAPRLSLKKGESTTLTVKASATNATITGYVFTVNGQEVQNSTSNKYEFKGDKAGKYDIVATVKSSIGNVSSETCATAVDIIEEIVPIYRCESFTLNKNKVQIGESFTATVRVTAKDGATFKQATFTFGDEASVQDKTIVNTINNGIVTANHIYSKSGDYGPRVKLAFMVNDKMVEVEDPACVAQINVTPTEVKGVKTTTLPNTGAGSIAGIFAAVTVAGTALHRRFTLSRQ